MNDYDLMAMRADVLFTYDARGRMLLSNEPREDARRPAPGLFLGRTSAGDVLRVGEGVPDVVARLLAEVIARQPPSADLGIPPATVAEVRRTLERHAPIAAESAGVAYRFPDSMSTPGEVVHLTRATRELARETYPWLFEEIDDWQPCFGIVRDEAVVSVCFSSRLGDRAAEAGLETLPAFRGRGYAGAVTVAWGAAVRASGRTPLYSTARDNLASRSVARRLGLIMFGVDMTWA